MQGRKSLVRNSGSATVRPSDGSRGPYVHGRRAVVAAHRPGVTPRSPSPPNSLNISRRRRIVSLRFDHFGTGDSSGSLDDDAFDQAWVEGVEQGVALLRSFGCTSVSAVGIRMGATILGKAAATYDLGLSSLVLWDPCETGRSYVREHVALGAIRRTSIPSESDEPTTMLEYVLSENAATQLHQFDLSAPSPKKVAERVLVVVREDRAVSEKFRARWDEENAQWATTSEQGPMLETELPSSELPEVTIERIKTWLTAPASTPAPLSWPPRSRDTVLRTKGASPIRESVVELGVRKMFAIVCEPVGPALGPLIVMVNGINEDHVGPSRLWVELSRRWAESGLRSVRFDLEELGESPWLPGQSQRPVLDKARSQDIGDAVRALNPSDPTDSVFVGLCSGAQLAMVVARKIKNRGVCAINPQVAAGMLRSAERLKKSDQESVRSFVRGVQALFRRYPWIEEAIDQLSLLALYPPKVSQALIEKQSEMFFLLSPEDLSRFSQLPVLGAALRRRLVSSKHHRVQIVPGLDHNFLSTLGRDRAVALLDRHVIETFVGAAGGAEVCFAEVDTPES